MEHGQQVVKLILCKAAVTLVIQNNSVVVHKHLVQPYIGALTGQQINMQKLMLNIHYLQAH
jgi:hypothetical protein